MRFFLIVRIAARNLAGSGRKTLNVGAMVAVAVMTAVLADAVVSTVLNGMRRSLVQSVSGDLQIYAAGARDNLSLFGTLDGNVPDIGQIDDFAAVRRELMASVPGIKAVIPMGTGYAIIRPGNLLDRNSERLRELFHREPRDVAAIAAIRERIKTIARQLAANLTSVGGGVILLDETERARRQQDLAAVLSDDFWQQLDKAPEAGLEFLTGRIAPLLIDQNDILLGYIGTPIASFANAMPLFELVKGKMIPPGAPGLLVNHSTYETAFKHPIARKLDAIKAKLVPGAPGIAEDGNLARMVGANVRGGAALASEMAAQDRERIAQEIAGLLGVKPAGAEEMLGLFFAMDDASFANRYRFFYERIAPHIELYRVPLGALAPLSSFSRRNTETRANLKLYGTFRFRGLEGSPLAGTLSLTDLATFRQLAGLMDAKTRHEQALMGEDMGAADVDEAAISGLFSHEGASKAQPAAERSAQKDAADPKEEARAWDPPRDRAITEDANGACLHAAVVLWDISTRATVQAEIQRVIRAKKLPIQVVDAEKAAGSLGQWMQAVALSLAFTLTFMFFIVAIIVASALVLVALGRGREIGTMRAIGASRGFISRLVWTETLLINLVFGALGLMLGWSCLFLLNHAGITLKSDSMQFFFNGSHLVLDTRGGHWGGIIAVIMLLTLATGWLPVKKAASIPPLSAMQTRD